MSGVFQFYRWGPNKVSLFPRASHLCSQVVPSCHVGVYVTYLRRVRVILSIYLELEMSCTQENQLDLSTVISRAMSAGINV